MNTRAVVGVAVLLCTILSGCDDGKTAYACGRPCVGNERCDVAQGRCVLNAPPTIQFSLPLVDTVHVAASVRLQGTVSDDSGLVREAFYRVGTTGEWTPLGVEVEGTFDATITLPALDGAPLELAVKAIDLDGVEGLGTRTIIIDRVAPACTVLSPTANAVLTGTTATVRLGVTDGSGQLGEASLTTDDATLRQPLIDGAARFEVALSSLDGAQRRWALQARDAAGNRCDLTLDVRVDNLGPAVVITQPLAGQSVTRGAGGAVPVAFSVTDGTGVASAEVQAPPSTLWQAATLSGDQGTFAWVVPANDEQVSRTLRVRATDTAGTVGPETTVTVSIDAVAPVCTLVSPTASQVLNLATGPVFTVTFRVRDGSNVLSGGEVSVDDGATWQPVSLDAMGNGTYPWVLDTTANGVVTRVRVRGRDGAGNVCPEQIATVTVDTVGPTIAVTTPAAGAALRAPSVAFSGTVRDGASDAASMTIDFADGTGARTVALSGQNWATSVPTLATEDFVSHAVVLRALDAAGNATTSTLVVRVDRVAPTLTVPRPTQGQRLGAAQLTQGAAIVEALAADGDPFLVVEAETAPSTFTPVVAGEHRVTTTATDNDVVYTQLIRARDTAGNVTSVTRTFRVDRVAPTVSFSSPAVDASVGGTSVAFAGAAADGSAPVAALTLDFADGVGARAIAPSGLGWAASVPSAPGEDFVPHLATLRATDAAGNTAVATRQVYVDRVAPRVSVSTPSEGQRFNIADLAAPLNLAGNMVDGDTQAVLEVDAGGGVWAPLSSQVVTTSPTDDDVEYVRVVRGRDRAGNETMVTRRFRVDRVAPTLLSTAPSNGQRNTPLEFSMQFSEPMRLGAGLPATFSPAPTGAIASIDGTGRLVTVRGLAGNQGYTAQMRPAGVSDLAGNAPAPATAVVFTTAPQRPTNGAVLIDATATRQVEWFRTSADEDGVVSMLVRVIDPTTQQRAWLFGWIDPQTGTFLQQSTLAGGNTGGSITSVGEVQPNGTVRRRATVRLGGTGTTYIFELGLGGFTSSVPFVFAVAPGVSEQAGTDVAAVSASLEYQRAPNPSVSFNRWANESPLQAAVLNANEWSVVNVQAAALGRYDLAYNSRRCSCSSGCGCTEVPPTMLYPYWGVTRPDLVQSVRAGDGLWLATTHFFEEGFGVHYPATHLVCAGTFKGSPGFRNAHAGLAAVVGRAGSNAVDVVEPSPFPDFLSGEFPVQIKRFTECGETPSSTTQFSLQNPTGSLAVEGPSVSVTRGYGVVLNYHPTPPATTLRLVVAEVAPVPGPTPGLLWLEAPGRLRYKE